MEKLCKFIVTLSYMMVCIFVFFTLPVKAEGLSGEITELNQVMTVSADCEAKEQPEQEAESVMSFTAGSSVWVVGETESGWYKVSYQGREGFILKDNVTAMQVETESGEMVNLEETDLDNEMAVLETEGKILVEAVERQRSEKKHSRIWTAVIILLVIGIFATGIISTMQANKKEKEGHDKKD